jgi:hypothetical protein
MAVGRTVDRWGTAVEPGVGIDARPTVSPIASTCRTGPLRSEDRGVVPFSTAPTTT